MAWGALSLAIAAFISMGLGVLLTPIPGVGAVFAFGAPVLALAGIIVGGRAVSRAKAAAPAAAGGSGGAAFGAAGAEGSGVALAAVIASALAFVPAMITALTCGACNALCAAGEIHTRHSFQTGIDPFDVLRGPSLSADDAGVLVPSAPVEGGSATDPSATDPSATDPSTPDPSTKSAEPLPPPPLAPGPPR